MPSAQNLRAANDAANPNDLAAWWLPFTPNRAFKARPRLISGAKGMHYYHARRTGDPRRRRRPVVLQRRPQSRRRSSRRSSSRRPISTSRRRSSSAIPRPSRSPPASPSSRRATSTTCSSRTPAPRRSTRRSRSRSPTGTCRARAQRTRLIGRERGYHGVGFGGISVGGIVNNRKFFGSLLAGVDHLPHTYNRGEQAFTEGRAGLGRRISPMSWSAIIALHDGSTIAAVIVEPMAGSTGVLPPPKGYLQKLRQICDRHGILLIFDEVITGFGRLGFAVRGRALRRRAGHDHLRQGGELRHRARWAA